MTTPHIVRFSEDAFALDIAEDSLTPTCEFASACCPICLSMNG